MRLRDAAFTIVCAVSSGRTIVARTHRRLAIHASAGHLGRERAAGMMPTQRAHVILRDALADHRAHRGAHRLVHRLAHRAGHGYLLRPLARRRTGHYLPGPRHWPTLMVDSAVQLPTHRQLRPRQPTRTVGLAALCLQLQCLQLPSAAGNLAYDHVGLTSDDPHRLQVCAHSANDGLAGDVFAHLHDDGQGVRAGRPGAVGLLSHRPRPRHRGVATVRRHRVCHDLHGERDVSRLRPAQP
mmetsp:Transcript_20415/g.53111  ORF Transcript_20415/g.53111 Transcript_20415/m.53111 type:complete len:240 (+) Transcript_20415:54-773(+)